MEKRNDGRDSAPESLLEGLRRRGLYLEQSLATSSRRAWALSYLLQIWGIPLLLAGIAGAFLVSRRVGGFGGLAPVWVLEVMASAGALLHTVPPMFLGTHFTTARVPHTTDAAKAVILYLRPFGLDAGVAVQILAAASTGGLVALALHWPLLLPFCLAPIATLQGEEERLQHTFGTFGRLLTFREPGRRLSPAGAARHRAGLDWKAEVSGYMRRARLVLVRPGSSEAIRWEIDELLRSVPPERVLFYFTGSASRRERAYQVMREPLQRVVPEKLPARLGSARFLVLDHAWRPRFISLDNRPATLLRQLASDDFERERLRPVFDALPGEFRLPPLTLPDRLGGTAIRWQSLLLMVAAGLATAFVIAAIGTLYFLMVLLRP